MAKKDADNEQIKLENHSPFIHIARDDDVAG